jgi:allantoin racemase
LRIAVIVPITGLNENDLAERAKALNSIKRRETVIEFYRSASGPPAIETRVDHDLAIPEVLRLAKQAEAERNDAAIIWCAGDPGLESARELVDIPVVGPKQASLSIAMNLGNIPVILPPPLPVLEMRKDLKKTLRLAERAGKVLIRDKNADVLILGCMGFFGLSRKISEVLGVPVIDPAEAALSVAETLAHLKLMHSRLTYPKYGPSSR